MASGKSTRLFYIFIFALVVGGILLFLGKLGILEIGMVSTKPLITPDELCELLNMDEDNRAGVMKEKEYEESVNASMQAIFYEKPNLISREAPLWIKFFTNENSSQFFWLTFNKRKDYDKFVNYVAKSYKINFKQDECLELIKGCALCNIGFSRGGNGYQILIERRNR